MRHRVGIEGGPEALLGVPEPEFPGLEPFVQDPEVAEEGRQVVRDAGMRLRPEGPAGRLLNGPAQLLLQPGQDEEAVTEEQELPEDGERDPREEEVGPGPSHPGMLTKLPVIFVNIGRVNEIVG
jgi:hypothetical protein